MNGTPGVLPPISQFLPHGPSSGVPTGYPPGYDARRENGEAPPDPSAEGYRLPPQPHGEQNGQDTEMADAGAAGFGGFTAVNR